MNKILYCIILIAIAATACNNGYNRNAIETISQSLQQSNELVTHKSNAVLKALNDKMKEPSQQAKAAIWLPKALTVKALTTAVTQYVDSLKQQLATYSAGDKAAVNQLFEKEGYRLFNKLVAYQQAIPEVIDLREFSDNPYFLKIVDKDRKIFRELISTYFELGSDTAVVDETIWIATYLKDNTPAVAQAVMARLKNDLLLTESMTIEYYNNQIGSCCCGYYSIAAICSLNYTQAKPDQLLEINAGIGFFSPRKARSIVRIDDHELHDSPDGTFVYKFKATGKPGTYYIPVSIQYNKPDGETTTFTRQLEYTIHK